ncbi:hypothetical protein HK104_006023 [Borealophlyctis nickersoniae]|nr:hypothetical protein HK104_006023 [Borealophlyctis nickersoniae]
MLVAFAAVICTIAALIRLWGQHPASEPGLLEKTGANYRPLQTDTMSGALLRSIVLPPKSTHTATVIFLHGLGDSGHGWAPVGKMLQPQLPHVKFVFPHAPSQPVTLNFGMSMPSWYDIRALAPGGTEDEAGLKESMAKIQQLIKAEVDAGIPPNRIVLGGFSQGAAVSLLTAVASDTKLAGFVGLSGYVPLSTEFDKHYKPTNKETPIFMGHGSADEVVNFQWGKMSYDLLSQKGMNVRFTEYKNMGHSSSDKEIADVARFLGECLP